MTNISDVLYNKDDVGKNVYRKKTTYLLTIEEDFIAENADKAHDMSMNTGLDYDKIKSNLVDTKGVSEVFTVDANYSDSDMKYIGKIKYDTDSYNQTLEEAIENEDMYIDIWADEEGEAEKSSNLDDKEESDVDVALNLEAEIQRGK